ncbi:MAG: V-type ATP synthase subunit E [Tissierellia bacterium]|nr:V-type ATP synthase subunit E [Tissierellia bacterium]
MSNLENLTEKILEDAKNQASIIEEESKSVNDRIINSKIKEANEEKKRILDRAASEASLLKERTISNAELKARNEKLRAKQEVIDKVFNIAKERLGNLDEDKYISYLQSTLKNLKLTGEEFLVVPKTMRDKVKKLGIRLKVSEDEVVDSGFLIKDEGTTLNYTFDSLVEHNRDEFEAEIAQSLFKE